MADGNAVQKNPRRDRVMVTTIDLSTFYTGTAKLSDLPEYERRARELAGEGKAIVLTGQAPIWMYLKIAHALHGKARKLIY
ncbi:MAG: CRISPR-associated protein Csx3, partial [Thermofilaceae archaeon]